MYLNNKNILAFLFAMSSLVLFSQDLTSDLENISKRLEKSNETQLVTEVKTYTKRGGTLIYNTKAELYRKGDSTATTLGDIQFLEVGKYHIRIDEEEKAILIHDKSQNTSDHQEISFSKKDLKSIKETLEALQNQQNSSNKIKYALVQDKNEIRTYASTNTPGLKEVRIAINHKKNTLVSITYEYGNDDEEGNFVEINYSTFSYSIGNEKVFDLEQIFTISGGKYKLSPKYQHYHLYTEL